MKTILNLKWYILIAITAFLFTSCLSDSDNYIEGSGTGYITSYDGQKYIAMDFGYLSADGLQNLEMGKYYYLRFSTKSLMSPTNIYQGQVLNVYNNGKPMDVFSLRTEKVTENGIPTYSLHIISGSDDKKMADGWTIELLAKPESKKELVPHFYYDVENQIDQNGNNVLNEKNKVIIDIRFTESDKEFDKENYYKVQRVVAKLGDLRNRFEADFSKSKPNNDSKKTAMVSIQFRCIVQDGSSEDKTKPQYIGSWDINNRNHMYMTFVEK